MNKQDQINALVSLLNSSNKVFIKDLNIRTYQDYGDAPISADLTLTLKIKDYSEYIKSFNKDI